MKQTRRRIFIHITSWIRSFIELFISILGIVTLGFYRPYWDMSFMIFINNFMMKHIRWFNYE